MNNEQRFALSQKGIDVDGTVKRLGGSEAMYISCLSMFLEDPTVAELNRAVDCEDWDDAFTAAHALKGLAWNMGFITLVQSSGQLVIMIRSGDAKGIQEYLAEVNSDYKTIITAIRENF